MPPDTAKVDRSTRWGNPFAAKTKEEIVAAVARYRAWIAEPAQAGLRERVRALLRGKNLACWCPLDGPCHADVLLALAND